MNFQNIAWLLFFSVLIILGLFFIRLLLSLNRLLISINDKTNSITIINNKKEHIQHTYQLLDNSYQKTKKKIYQFVPLLVFYMLYKRHYKHSNEIGIRRIKDAVAETTKDSIRINLIKL